MLETIVVGVGLYGLSATAHLQKAGVKTQNLRFTDGLSA
jgi:phytoene dehydrogenase-like protein